MINLTVPSFLFGSVVAILLGAIYHLWQGGDWKIFLLAEFASLLGFWFGHFLGFIFNLQMANLGPIFLAQAMIGSVLALGFVHWLGHNEIKNGKLGKEFMTWTLHGTHAQEGDLVQLVGLSHKHFLVTLKAEAILQTHRGILKHDDIIGQPFGSKLESHIGRPFFLLQPSIADLLSELPRATQIMYPKDVGFLLMTMGIGPGQYVLEAGTGSGGLTSILAYYVGTEGKVFTYERNESHLGKAKKNIRNLGMTDRVVFHQGDAEEGFEERNVDAVFLDMANPYDVMHHVKASLKYGGFFGAIQPTTNQVSKLVSELRNHGFQYIQVVETFFRYYKPQPDRLRPVDRMVAHTGFLVFARNMVTEDFDTDEMRRDQGIFKPKGE